MTNCNRCGAAYGLERTRGGGEEGKDFIEGYECVNGHYGRIEGTEGEPGDTWTYTGPIFD